MDRRSVFRYGLAAFARTVTAVQNTVNTYRRRRVAEAEANPCTVIHRFCRQMPRERRPLPCFPCEESASLVSFHVSHRSRPRRPCGKKVLGLVEVRCRKCSLVIEPEDPIITIYCGSPSKFEKCEITWHPQCAPMIVRHYVP